MGQNTTGMTYQFESEIAKLYGINEAIFLHNIAYWVQFNAANNQHCYNGKFWTYNTKRAYTELFPFWTYEQVKKIINNLRKNELLLAENLNKNSRDRTLWYTLSEKAENLYKIGDKVNKHALLQKQQCNGAKTTMQSWKSNNAMVQKQQCIIGANNKTQIINTDSESALCFLEKNIPTQIEAFKMQFEKEIKDFKKFCKDFEDTVIIENLPYTPPVLLARLRKYARNWVANQQNGTLRVVKNENNNNNRADKLYSNAI